MNIRLITVAQLNPESYVVVLWKICDLGLRENTSILSSFVAVTRIIKLAFYANNVNK